MYAAIRPALRSTSSYRRPARFIRGRRYTLPYRVQSFHSSPSRAQTPNPPPASDNTPVDKHGTNTKAREEAAAAEQTEAGVATEDTDGLAQKLQRSKELTRRYSSALKRSQRRNRAQDLPPIYIPEWFLESRVRLREERPRKRAQSQSSQCALSIKNAESGDHGICSIPVTDAPGAVRSVSRVIKAMWGASSLSDERRKLLARDLARKMGQKDDDELTGALGHGEDSAIDDRAKDTSPPGNSFSDPEKHHIVEKHDVVTRNNPDAREAQKTNENLGDMHSLQAQLRGHLQMLQSELGPPVDTDEFAGKHVSPLLLAEIRATIAASLSAVHPAINDSFPSAKTNLILHCPSSDREASLHNVVESLAVELDTDLVTLQAQDLAQITGDYLGEGPDPSPHSIRSLGYETYKHDLANGFDDWAKPETYEDDDTSSADQSATSSLTGGRTSFFSIILSKSLHALRVPPPNSNNPQAVNIGQGESNGAASTVQSVRTQNEVQLEELKLSTLLEALVDSNQLKRNRGQSLAQENVPPGSVSANPTNQREKAKQPSLFDFSYDSENVDLDLTFALPTLRSDGFALSVSHRPVLHHAKLPSRLKIIYIKDIKELNATQYGSRIIQKLEDIVRRQRNVGEHIMMLGTTCSEDLVPEMSSTGVQSLQSEGQSGFFRTIVVPTGDITKDNWWDSQSSTIKDRVMADTLSRGEKRKFRDINLRHIQDMLRCLDPVASERIADMKRSVEQMRKFSQLFPESCSLTVLTYDQVHRIALAALGLYALKPSSGRLNWAHVTLAMGLLKASDEVKYAYMRVKAPAIQRSLKDRYREQMELEKLKGRGRKPQDRGDRISVKRQPDLATIKLSANSHEKKLMHGIVNPDQIKTTFDQIHVPQDTVEAIRILTSMSLLRPDAFNYGVLATEKISGALLYGPPGTGKTLLAKAVAKESGSAVLEVSGSSIMDKYVGEGEKNVAAIFSLARKLSPCIVFLDEADAIFGTRDAARERTSHRDILNQFLKEWDGLNDSSVFVMVATNRPFDMDDAVIRRLPRRLLVDLPTQEDRKKILDIHLRGEQIDPSVDLNDLAKRTPLYSGSDLKNVAVFAALACVREENKEAAINAARTAADAAQAASSETLETAPFQTAPVLVQGQRYDFPERRILHARHFDKALQEVSASISENMSSLNAIKKFDEQYGDRKGRRKKMYGFGVGAGQDESAARVRT